MEGKLLLEKSDLGLVPCRIQYCPICGVPRPKRLELWEVLRHVFIQSPAYNRSYTSPESWKLVADEARRWIRENRNG